MQFVQFVHFSSFQDVFPPFCFSLLVAMPVEGPGQALPHANKDDKVVPQSFKNIEKGQWVVFLKKGSHGARFSGLVSKMDKGKVSLTNTKEYTEDTTGNVNGIRTKGTWCLRRLWGVGSFGRVPRQRPPRRGCNNGHRGVGRRGLRGFWMWTGMMMRMVTRRRRMKRGRTRARRGRL